MDGGIRFHRNCHQGAVVCSVGEFNCPIGHMTIHSLGLELDGSGAAENH